MDPVDSKQPASNAPNRDLSRWQRIAQFFILLVVLASIIAPLSFWIDFSLHSPGLGVDDADIYRKYGRNLAAGFGLVYNPYGSPVEGCTSLAWTAVNAITFRFTSSPLVFLRWAAIVFCAAALAGLIWSVEGEHLEVERRAKRLVQKSLLLLVVLAVDPGFFLWMTSSGLDGGLWLFALTATLWATLGWVRKPSLGSALILGAVLAALPWCRPEGIICSLVFSLMTSFVRVPVHSTRILRGLPLLGSTGSLLILFGFRRLYFGDWLPNTYYAKVDGDLFENLKRGGAYWLRWLSVYPHLVAGFLFLCFRGLRRGSERISCCLVIGLMLLVILTTLSTGGDHFPLARVGQPLAAFSALGWVWVLDAILRGLHRHSGSVGLLVAFVCVVVGAGGLHWRGGNLWYRLDRVPYLAFEFHLPVIGRRVGGALNEIFAEPRPRVGVIAAGGLPFVYEGAVFDLLGLNHREMAKAHRRRRGPIHGHGAFDAEVFFRSPPEIVIPPLPVCSVSRPETAQPAGFFDLVLGSIHTTRRFQELYAPFVLTTRLGRADDVGFACFLRRDFAASLPESVLRIPISVR